LEASFLKEMGGHTLFQRGSRRNGFRGVVWYGGFFSLAMDLQAFSGELVWFAPLLGRGNNLERIYYVRPK
jgi:hypothetical protein